MVLGASLVLIVLTTTIFATAIWTRPFTLAESARGGWLTSFALTLFVIALLRDPGRDDPVVRVARHQVLAVGGSRAGATQVVRDRRVCS